MLSRIVIPVALIVTLSFSLAWAQDGTLLDRNWGKSFATEKQLQIAQPEAAKTQTPATGLDGIAAKVTIDKYRASFKGKSSQQGETGGTQTSQITYTSQSGM